MSKLTPASKSQIRAASLLNVSIDAADYVAAGAALEAAGAPSAGLPTGLDWRAAGKLSDADLLARLGRSDATTTARQSLDDRRAHSAYIASTTGMERRMHRSAAMLGRLAGERETGDERIDDFAQRGPSRQGPWQDVEA